MLGPGTVVGDPSRRYQIVRVAGRGGMGEVYEATQLQLGRRVALKTIRAELAARPELLARFRREAESAAALGHPNLVQVTDFQANPGEPAFLVMEMLDGETLADVLEREGRLDPARAAFIGVQLLSGLAAAHRAGIVHRDVKPANVFLQSTSAMRDLVKVLDFGVAKLALDATPGANVMTQAGQVIGTLAYMAPEQATTGATVDARADIFGVGGTLFHALAGVGPFNATEPGIGRASIDRVAPWVDRELAALVERALQRAPDARWPNADEMAAALQPFSGGGGGPRISSPSAPPKNELSGWNPAAIGRLEAPTGGGSSFGSSPDVGGSSPNAYAPTAPGSDPAVFTPRDATLLGHGARAPGAHVPPPPVDVGPPPFAPAGAYGIGASAPAGAVPIAIPHGYGHAYPSTPPPHARGYAPPVPHAGGGKPWWILVVLVVALGVMTPYAYSFIAYRNATNPDNIATTVEREVLKQARPPCPQFEQCSVTTEEHGLTYTTCTKALASSLTYKPGEMIVGGKDTRIAIITSDLPGRRHTARFLSQQQDVELADDEIIGRLCKSGPKNLPGQTVP